MRLVLVPRRALCVLGDRYMAEPKRYFFDLEGGERSFRDPDGALLPGPDAARTPAEQIIVLRVKDENGNTIFSIPFVDSR